MSSTELTSRPLRLQRIEELPATGRVRHFDELSERAQTLLVEVSMGEESAIVAGADGFVDEFVDGEVVVFTDYYRVHLP